MSGSGRARLRELGIEVGVLPTGPLNAITDVAGVSVGHRTIQEGDSIRTGVTAVRPHGLNPFQEKAPAGVCVGNGFGKAAGFLQVQELGQIETPIVLTNTLAVGAGVSAVARWTLTQDGNEEAISVNAIVGETNDGYLNDIRAMRVREDDVIAAIHACRTGAVEEGCVGAGTGTRALGFKGGIGTASRRLPDSLGGWTVGVLAQSNFGGVLTCAGRQIGKELGAYALRERIESGSCMIVVATDAPLGTRALERLASRTMLGLGRSGGFMAHGSGDMAIAFSTAYTVPHPPRVAAPVDFVPDHRLDGLFLGCVEATEEAILNSLTMATTVSGFRGRSVEAVPLEAFASGRA